MRLFTLLSAIGISSIALCSSPADAAARRQSEAAAARKPGRMMTIRLASGKAVRARIMMMNGRPMVVAPLDAFPSGG